MPQCQKSSQAAQFSANARVGIAPRRNCRAAHDRK